MFIEGEIEGPVVYVMMGFPGSGKSYWAGRIQADRDLIGPIVSSDQYVEQLCAECGKTYNEGFRDVIGKALKMLAKKVDWLTSTKQSFVWDQTNMTVAKRQRILNMIPKEYTKILVHVDTPIKVALKRNQTRERTLPEFVIHDMAKSYEPATRKEGWNAIYTVFN